MSDLVRLRSSIKSWMMLVVVGGLGVCSGLCAEQSSSGSATVYDVTHQRYLEENTAFNIPLSHRIGIEYSVSEQPLSNDLVAVSITSQYFEQTGVSLSNYAKQRPLVFRITVKGYSLFQSENRAQEYFSLERVDENDIRRAQFLISLTKHF